MFNLPFVDDSRNTHSASCHSFHFHILICFFFIHFIIVLCARSNMSSAGKHCMHVFTRGQPLRPSRGAAIGGLAGGGTNVSGLLAPVVASSAGFASASAGVGSSSTSSGAEQQQQQQQQTGGARTRGCKTFLLAFDTENELALAFCALIKVCWRTLTTERSCHHPPPLNALILIYRFCICITAQFVRCRIHSHIQ